mmetsp:Transcript_28317/g.83162  ORF Transcript_28317/g.83162 Transcript_28317/m.83162 type:complete len:375 (-) Transcript_28317:10-1134(-)
MEVKHLSRDELFERLLVHGRGLKVKAEGRLREGLIARVVQRCEVGVCERLLHGDALGRVEEQQFVEQVDGHGVSVGVDLLKGDLWLKGQGPDVPPRLLRLDVVDVLVVGGADDVRDEVELVDVVLTWEERLPPEELCKDAPHRPHVDGLRVLLPRQHDFRCPVPPRGHVLRHEPRVVLFGVCHAREAEVTHLEVAVAVEEEVGRLQVPVEHVCRVDVFEAAKDLVEEVLAVVVGERLRRRDDLVQVCVHELRDNVHILKHVQRARPEDVLDLDHVLVSEVAQDLDLPQGALRVCQVVEGLGDLLDGHFLARPIVKRRAHDAIGAVAYGLDECVARVHVEPRAAHHKAVHLARAICVLHVLEHGAQSWRAVGRGA